MIMFLYNNNSNIDDNEPQSLQQLKCLVIFITSISIDCFLFYLVIGVGGFPYWKLLLKARGWLGAALIMIKSF